MGGENGTMNLEPQNMAVEDIENTQDGNNNNFSSLGAPAAPVSGSVPLPTPAPNNNNEMIEEDIQEEIKMEDVVQQVVENDANNEAANEYGPW